MQDVLDRMCEIVGRHVGRLPPEAGDGVFSRVGMVDAARPPRPVDGVYPPTMALILSGKKDIAIGRSRLHYDPASYFIATVSLPATGCVQHEPFRAVSLTLDPLLLASLLPETARTEDLDPPQAAFAVNPVTPELLDAWWRLLRLLDTPSDIAALAPLAEREILYRLLQGPQGAILRQIARTDSRHGRVGRAIALIRGEFDRPLRSERLADAAGMSVASLHRHFRAATAMSPLQYQKALRLHEARRLLLGGREVSASAYAVGYESPSQFSRDYSRLFGTAPSRDAVRAV